MFTAVLALIGWKGIVIGILVLWLVVALIKRLLKIAVVAAIILFLVYMFYPLAEAALKLK